MSTHSITPPASIPQLYIWEVTEHRGDQSNSLFMLAASFEELVKRLSNYHARAPGRRVVGINQVCPLSITPYDLYRATPMPPLTDSLIRRLGSSDPVTVETAKAEFVERYGALAYSIGNEAKDPANLVRRLQELYRQVLGESGIPTKS